MKIERQKITFREALVSNTVQYKVRANALMFRNKGTTTAWIDHNLELSPGESVSFNSDHPSVIFVQAVTITFTGAGSNRLEVIQINTVGERFENYTEKPGA